MKTQVIVISGLLAMAGGLAWWLNITMRTPPPGVASHSTTIERHTPAAASRQPAQREAVEDGSTAAAQTVCRARIQVVMASGEPAVGAEVLYWPPDGSTTRGHSTVWRRDSVDIESVLRAGGSAAIADERGFVEILIEPDTEVCARLGDTYGELSMTLFESPSTQIARIELARDVTLRIEVVGGNADPLAGRMVVVWAEFLSRRRGFQTRYEEVGPTDAEGVIVVEHARHRFRLTDDAIEGQVRVSYERRNSDASTIVIAAETLLLESLVGETKVRLIAPVGGTIVATPIDADGRPASAFVWLRAEDGSTFDIGPEVRDNQLWFRGLPLGRRWSVVARCGGLDHEVEVEGPRVAGEQIAVEVRVPLRAWQLVARVVRADGEPVGDARVTCRIPEWFEEPFDVETRDDGTLRLVTISLPESIRYLTFVSFDIETPLGQPRTYLVERPLPPGLCDLGDIVLAVPGGECMLATIEPRCDGRPLVDLASVRLYVAGGEHLEPVPAIAQRRGNTIEFRGVPPERPMVVVCDHPDCVRRIVRSLRVGARTVVDLPRAASLHVLIEAPDVPRDEIDGELIRVGEQWDIVESLDPDQQSLSWSKLEPGRYALRIVVRDRVLCEQPALELRAGHNRWPADGSRLDMRGLASALYLSARSAATARRVWVDALQVPVGMTAPPFDDDQSFDQGWFLPQQPRADLLVRAPGYVPVRVPAPTTDVFLRLQSVTELELEVAAPNHDNIRVRIIDDAVQDLLLRAFDNHNPHDPEFDADLWSELTFAAGTVLEFRVVRDDVVGAPTRVIVGADSPQIVTIR